MRYVIYGAGAIGGVIGARLSTSGKEVVLIARGPHLQAIRERGLTVRAPSGIRVLRLPAFSSPAEAGLRSDDVAFLTMKTQDTAQALEDLRAAGGAELPVVCAQNGVENERLALRLFPRVYGMLVILPASHLEPGIVQAESEPIVGILDLGCYPAGLDSLCETIAGDLNHAGFNVQVQDRIMRWKYAKLLTNLGNAIQAACGPEAQAGDLARAAREEALACYAAAGIDCATDAEMRDRRGSYIQLRAESGRQGGSTWQSLARGAGSSESDFLNGEIVLLGRLHGIPTPMNRALQEIAGRLAREGKPPGSVEPEEVRALAASLG